MNYKRINDSINPLDKEIMQKASEKWDNIAKPVGSLGELEKMLIKISGMQNQIVPDLSNRCVVVSCSDNGITRQGVAMTPSEVSALMTDYISQYKSSVGAMAKTNNCDVFTYDCGLFRHIVSPDIFDCHIASGTNDMTLGPAMTRDQAEKMIQNGIDLIGDLKEEEYDIVATGEMGIGNTSTSSAVASVLLGLDVEQTTGRGVGLSDEGYQNKINAIKKAIMINAPDPADPIDVLSKVGGYDIAHMVGLYLGGAIHQMPVIIDGVISAVSALLAYRLCPKAVYYMLPSHLSPEPSCGLALREMGLRPVIDAGMRLGEGTGAVCLLPLLDTSLAVYKNTITYKDLGF